MTETNFETETILVFGFVEIEKDWSLDLQKEC